MSEVWWRSYPDQGRCVMNCVVCQRTLRTPNKVYCCAGCRLMIMMTAGDKAPSEDEFASYELGELTSQEVVLFLGRVVRAGIVNKLAPHYVVAIKSLQSSGIIKEDGEVDLMKHHDMTKGGRHE